MGRRTKKAVVVASGSGMVIGTGAVEKKHRRHIRKRWHIGPRMRLVLLVAPVAVLVLGIPGAGIARWHTHHSATVSRQKTLQNSAYENIGEPDKLAADTTSLIQGAANGTYHVSDKQLAMTYAARGDAELNSGNNEAAVADYKKAVELDSSQVAVVGYGEFLARYRLGERKTLVPLLQQLNALIKNSREFQDQDQSAAYEQYITDLQQGQELPL